jgi:hypothetical protein
MDMAKAREWEKRSKCKAFFLFRHAGFVLSHPSRKNKGAARVGHPICFIVQGRISKIQPAPKLPAPAGTA